MAATEKQREQSRRWYREHPEVRRAQKKRWYKRHRAEVIDKVREWNKENPEKRKAIRKKWAALNPEKDRDSKLASAGRRRGHKNDQQQIARKTPERRRAEKNSRLKANYGITHEQYDAMHEAQGGVCAICHKPETRVIRGIPTPLIVDHDHATGAVRKLLCHRCNASIGFLDENPDRMRAMAAYVEEHGA